MERASALQAENTEIVYNTIRCRHIRPTLKLGLAHRISTPIGMRCTGKSIMRNEKGQFVKGHNGRIGKKHSEEAKRKIGKANKGKKRSQEARKKMSESRKGEKNHFFGKKHSEETRLKISRINRGRKLTDEQRKKITKSLLGNKHSLGIKYSEERKKRISEISKKKAPRGEKCHLWRGGISPINKLIRASAKYKEWRKAVFKRDNYTCVWCGDNTGGNLNADHIKQFAYYPELRFELSNGRTLCEPCHKKTDTYLHKGIKKPPLL